MATKREIFKEIRRDGFSFCRLSSACPELNALKNLPQDLAFHGEGDVYSHTRMVCERLTSLPEWATLSEEDQTLLFLAAAFHDIGKITCTKQEDGIWISPRHTIAGEKRFRQMAYRDAAQFGLTFRQRETVAKLIRYHGLPVWFWAKEKPAGELLKAAESIPLRLLYLLSRADVEGRIAADARQLEDQVEFFADYAKELGIWEQPYTFANPYTKFLYYQQYLQKEDLWYKAKLYDDTAFDVLLMSGLPLSGKDSWIAHYNEKNTKMPVVSLDGIRRQYGIPPAKNTGKVAQLATNQAKNFLRQEQPFIWNATNIVQETRQRLVGLFAGYHARVHILYLEAPYQELLDRNQKRTRYIPGPVLEDMIGKLEIPAPWEAYTTFMLPDHSSQA